MGIILGFFQIWFLVNYWILRLLAWLLISLAIFLTAIGFYPVHTYYPLGWGNFSPLFFRGSFELLARATSSRLLVSPSGRFVPILSSPLASYVVVLFRGPYNNVAWARAPLSWVLYFLCASQ